MISRELFSIRVQTNLLTMEMTSWWRNLFLSFSRSRFSEKRKWTSMKTYNAILKKKKNKLTNTQVNSNFPWSVLLSTIEMTSKCLKLCCGTTSRHNIALAILRETSTKIDVKTFNDIVKKKNKTNKQTNQKQFSMVCTLIDHRNDVKMFKTLRQNHQPTYHMRELPEPSFLCCPLVFWRAKSACAWATFFDKREQ